MQPGCILKNIVTIRSSQSYHTQVPVRDTWHLVPGTTYIGGAWRQVVPPYPYVRIMPKL